MALIVTHLYLCLKCCTYNNTPSHRNKGSLGTIYQLRRHEDIGIAFDDDVPVRDAW